MVKRYRSSSGSAIIPYGYNNTNAKVQRMKMYRSLGLKTRVHSFKRMGAPLIIRSDVASGTGVNAAGNVSMLSNTSVSTNPSTILAYTRSFGLGLKFNISQLTNVSDITNLFDQYRIKAVSLMFSLSYNSVEGQFDSTTTQGARSASLPIMNIANDPDDANTPSAQSDVLQLSKCKTIRLGDKILYHSVAPRAQQAIGALTAPVGGGPVTTGIGMLPAKTWIDNQSVVDHYGVKVWIDAWPQVYATPNDRDIALVITPTFYLEAKTIH